MEAAELRTLAEVEDRHWWYKERRSLLAKELRRLPKPGLALDIGAAGGGNTRVLRAHGWRPIALEYAPTAAQIARERGIDVIRGDARQLPVGTGALDLGTAFDVLEHIGRGELLLDALRCLAGSSIRSKRVDINERFHARVGSGGRDHRAAV